MSMIIALTGPQQVGKSTTAESLVRHHNYARVAFADPLYLMLASLMGLSSDEVRRLEKNQPIEALNGRTLRHALQTLGTEWGRKLIDPEIWVCACTRRVKYLSSKGIPVVVDDCRFDNEMDALRVIGAKIVRLHRDNLPEQVGVEHHSECDWPYFDVDAVVRCDINDAVEWGKVAGDRVLSAVFS